MAEDEPHQLAFTVDLEQGRGWPGSAPQYFDVTDVYGDFVTLRDAPEGR